MSAQAPPSDARPHERADFPDTIPSILGGSLRLTHYFPHVWTQPRGTEPFALYWSEEQELGQLFPVPSADELTRFYVDEYYTHEAGLFSNRIDPWPTVGERARVATGGEIAEASCQPCDAIGRIGRGAGNGQDKTVRASTLSLGCTSSSPIGGPAGRWVVCDTFCQLRVDNQAGSFRATGRVRACAIWHRVRRRRRLGHATVGCGTRFGSGGKGVRQ